jgi:hypothetical protein
MKKILYLTLVAALAFDFAAGAYLMRLLDARQAQRNAARAGLAQGADTPSHAKVKPVYAIY